jgi:hypothetical protein
VSALNGFSAFATIVFRSLLFFADEGAAITTLLFGSA